MQPNAATRQTIGRWLAGLYLSEMDTATLALYRSDEGKQFLDDLDAIPSLHDLVGTLRSLGGGEADIETIRLDHAAAYGQLFLIGGPRAVPLHASAYLDERGLLMQETTRKNEAILESLNLSAPPGFNEPADHIGIQLGILAELASAETIDGLNESDFLQQYLLPWIPTFAALCARLSPVPLYRDLAGATLGWLRDLEAQIAPAQQDA